MKVAAAASETAIDEPAADAIGELDDGRFFADAAFDNAHEPADAAVVADAFDADAKDRALVLRSAEYFAAGADGNRKRFTGEQGLKDVGIAGFDESVGRDGVAAANLDQIARGEGFDGDFVDRTIRANDPAGRGRQGEQKLDGVIGVALLAELQETADQQEKYQDRQRVEINLRRD